MSWVSLLPLGGIDPWHLEVPWAGSARVVGMEMYGGDLGGCRIQSTLMITYATDGMPWECQHTVDHPSKGIYTRIHSTLGTFLVIGEGKNKRMNRNQVETD